MRKQKEKTELQLFFAFFKPHWKLFALDLSCALLVALVDLAFPLVSRAAMYDLLPNQKYHTFFVVMVIVVAAYLVRTVLYYILSYWGHTFGAQVSAASGASTMLGLVRISSANRCSPAKPLANSSEKFASFRMGLINVVT